jgi:hypothetical protein
MVSFVHCATTVTSPTGTSSSHHFLRILHAMSFVAIWVDASLILLMMIPSDPLSVPYFFFISSSREFSLICSSRYCVGLSPIDERHVMNEISSTSMETGSSIHRKSPWRTSINCLMHLSTSLPVITEKLSTALQTMVEQRHQCQQQLVHLHHQNPSKRKKTIYLVQKPKCANSPKEARVKCTQCAC